MDNMVIHEISFSFEQPDQVLNAMLNLLQERLKQSLVSKISKISKEMVVRNALTILIIDMQYERAQYVGGLLTTAGYRTVVTVNELEAFTSFLQGNFLPLAIVLRSEDNTNRLFLNRLRQQLVQKYDWEPLFIRLQDTSPAPFQALRSTDGYPKAPDRPFFQSRHNTRPLNPRNNTPKRESDSQRQLSNGMPSTSISSTNHEALSSNPDLRLPFAPTNSTSPSSFTPHPAPRTGFSTSPNNPTYPPRREQPSAPLALPREQQTGKNEPVRKEKVYLDGQSLGRYHIRARLGSSTYSEVYKAYDRLREQESALKAIQVDLVPFYVMDNSPEEVTIFQQEADLLGPLQHPHILPVSSCGKSYIGDVNFIYKNMPFCAEGSLASWLQRNKGWGSFSLKDLLPIILQLADALQFVHNYRVTYQNFKFTNILVFNRNKRIQKLEVAFSDFSVVQDGSSFPITPDDLPYIAPERWDHIVSPASDQYGFAAIVYELLTGRPPFQGTTEHVMKILHTTKIPPPPSSLNPKLPSTVDVVFSTALAKKPGDRFGSISSMAQTLQRC